MSNCNSYNPDDVFKRFKVVEFPISFVGLSTTLELDVEFDLDTSAYLKTLCEGRLMKFDEAFEISAAHRAFSVKYKNSHTIEITFTPKNECITKAKYDKQFDNRFVFDLRLIKVDGSRCCYDEFHSEIGRYYISGQFEYPNVHHTPENINFGDVIINTKTTKCIRIQNESVLSAKMQYVRIPGINLDPETFTIPPNTSKKIAITIKSTCLKLKNIITLEIINPHDVFKESSDKNCITYTVHFNIKVIYKKSSKQIQIESLHKLNELNPTYTYTGKELLIHNERNKLGLKYLQMSKMLYEKIPILEKYTTDKHKCYTIASKEIKDNIFYQAIQETPSTYDLFQIRLIPFTINFGRVGASTYGEHNLIIHNNTKFNISVEFFKDKFILYSDEKKVTLKMKVKSFVKANVTIFCLAHMEGTFSHTFKYTINEKYHRNHPYTLQIGNPTLMVNEKSLKFGMVTTETFVTSVPIRIYNHFNLPVDFKWDELHPDTPFEIIPKTGTIPRHSCRLCDVQYICKPNKTKTHEVELLSISKCTRTIPFELSVVTRKLSIKFLQTAVTFKDIALNMETVENVKLENSSREIALFHVVEPLIQGLRIEPMCGTIRPKVVMVFDIIVKIPCILEFNFDIYIKINNKENVILPVSGNVVEPKLLIHPKNIYMPRIPCNMITFVPVTFQNLSVLKTVVEVLDTGDDNIFDVYVMQGNERKRIFYFNLDGGQSKTVYIKVYDIFRREYEMYIPFRINGLLGPPNQNLCSTELRHYIEDSEKSYENNPKIKIKSTNKDICYCRITGVITVPWITFSVDKFEMIYIQNIENTMDFAMTNISKYCLPITIVTSKLSPIFTLDIHSTEDSQIVINENNMKFELNIGKSANFTLKFQPKGHGRFVSTALLYLDKLMTIPYYNLTFIGKRQIPDMYPDTYKIIFPPCSIGTELRKMLTLKMDGQSTKELFSCSSKEEPNLTVEFIDSKIELENETYYTYVSVKVSVSCQTTYVQNITLNFQHTNGSCCEVEVCFCFTYCPLTLHSQFLVKTEESSYPYFPLKTQFELYNYMEVCCSFLEKWMFQQGFRRDLYPIIPDTFHAISASISTQSGGAKSKGINVSYLNFVRRIAGPLMKHIRKISVIGVDESYKCVKEIHDTYREILILLRSRGANVGVLQAKFLLSYEQFVIYSDNTTPRCNADIILTQQLLADVVLFNRLSKQSWIDLILQSYKVFVMDSCFFECVCMSTQPRDIIKILTEWYNENILLQHEKLRGKKKTPKIITNITTDLTDGIAIISTILTYCPFMEEHFQLFCDDCNNCVENNIINNACLIIEAMNILKLYFPLSSKDFLHPNFLVMLFLSIHLFVTLPMFKTKDLVEFNPPLLRSSTRLLAISPSNQESLIFNYIILNNIKSNFTVEKTSSADTGKKIYLSVKYTANFVAKETAVLLVHGFNKTRIFDTFIIFILSGHAGSLYPIRKCKVTGPLYRPNKVDVLVASPFAVNAVFKLHLTDNEPVIPVTFEKDIQPKFCINRLYLIDQEITLSGIPKESGQEVLEHKLYFQIVCLSTQMENSWLWFRSDVGEFFIRITTQPRWDLAIDTLQVKVQTWPIDPCSCGEACECYRTTAVMVPHRNELMVKSLRYALLEQASDTMIHVFDQLIETATGKIILGMLLKEGGSNLSEVQHILKSEATFRITSKTLFPRLEKVTLAQHTNAFLALPVTIPAKDKSEKYAITLTSECGMDIRTYRIIFIESTVS
ncbi:uncharacterized protein LOC125076895 [Vanessa atalanta]|uniref:uncharacterized protein LOC125076895 n=1 Tax=Vanessa atalanta TaxID=42275 RepID=UPI001FCD2170|nr:uncharacterized protein LOC125076895 [Vanessa atalanta]